MTDIIRFALFISILFSSVSLGAQVTIGSSLRSNTGALLDLKEKNPNIGNATSDRGLAMPRVELTEIDQLFPMFVMDADYISGITKDALDKQHIGLMVYNTNMCIDNNSLYNTGMYVWDGKAWENVSPADGGGVLTYVDQDGKQFRARSFGNAGVWMIENLAVSKYAPGVESGASLGVPLVSGVDPNNVASSHTARVWCYPGSRVLDPSFYNIQPSLGYLYNWAAATNKRAGAAGAGNNVEEGGTDGTEVVQGICPDGWHLPSDREWTGLENEIITHTSQYASINDIGAASTLGYDRGRGSFGKHGEAMKGRCMIAESTLGNSFGRSFPAAAGGFDAYLSGYAPGPDKYGETTYFWTSSFFYDSSSSSNYSAWHRKLDAVSNSVTVPSYTVTREVSGRQHLFSVRCKKN